MRNSLKRALSLALFTALTGCASYGADDFAEGMACGPRENLCVSECDKAFEVNQNSWDYAACTDRCQETAGSACY